jgi:archaellum component FlaC
MESLQTNPKGNHQVIYRKNRQINEIENNPGSVKAGCEAVKKILKGIRK